MNSNTNVFETRTYEVKDFANKDEMVKHLEFKINAVKEEHKSIWRVTNTDKNITETTAKATIHMVRN